MRRSASDRQHRSVEPDAVPVRTEMCRRCRNRPADGECRDRLCFHCREFLDALADESRWP